MTTKPISKETVLNSLQIKTYYETELPSIKWNGGSEGSGLCPFHQDTHPSLSVNLETGLFYCHSCKQKGDVFGFHMAKHGLSFPEALEELAEVSNSNWKRRGRGGVISRQEDATAQHSIQPLNNAHESADSSGDTSYTNATPRVAGVTVKNYAEAKRLDLDYLKRLGLSDITYNEAPALRIPYYDAEGNDLSVRIRTALYKSSDGQDDRFRWKKGSKLYLYGLHHKFSENYRILVEGESDCHTLWFHGFPAYGVPGATHWKEDRDAPHFDDVNTIYVVLEPDTGGEALRNLLSKSRIKERAKVLSLNGFKDPSALHIDNPELFRQRMQTALDSATPWVDIERAQKDQTREELWSKCKALASQTSILDAFIHDVHSLGVEGEDSVAQTIFLSLISRYLGRPVSNIVKGQSSGGKSFVVQETLKFFPQSAYFSLTDMSARLLAFTDEPLEHRFIVLYEAAGLSNGNGKENEGEDQTKNYFIRSLLSEGCIDYGITVKTKNGFEGRKIHKDGPTGLILTTTKVALHPENETRYLSFTINDTPEQTKNVLRAIARKESNLDYAIVDFDLWHSFHAWLDLNTHTVFIPFAMQLAEEIPPVAVRLRRDFTLLLNLIKAHTILHQATREKDSQGRILATLNDYAAVRGLISGVISDGVGATVDKKVREVVTAVENILAEHNECATMQQLVERLKLHKSTISRRVLLALTGGYLANSNNNNRKPYKLVLGEQLPDEVEILPSPERIGSCEVARSSREDMGASPPSTDTDDFIHEDDEPPEQPRFHGGAV